MDNQTNKPVAFAFAGGELAIAVVENLGLDCNVLSPFANVGSAPISRSAETLKAVNSAEFRRAATILARPFIKLSGAKGGGALPVEPFAIYGRPTAPGLELAALLQPGEASLVLYFPTAEPFLDWWLDLFACKANAPAVNHLLPALPAEEFTFVLHALDTVRRLRMESLLLYRPLKECRIPVQDFEASFTVALNSGDVRWLLPAFFSLTPGLANTVLDLQPDVVDLAESLDLIRHAKNPDSGADELIYGEAGTALGYEFATSWTFGVGLLVEALTANGLAPVGREFLAPTAVTNHLVTVARGKAAFDTFSHRVLTADEYRAHLAGLLQAAKALVPPLTANRVASPPVAASAPQPTAPIGTTIPRPPAPGRPAQPLRPAAPPAVEKKTTR